MTADTRQIRRVCPYCLGVFVPTRSDKKACSTGCTSAKSAALKADEVMPAICRRDGFSAARLKATGWGNLTAKDREEADVRVRAAAGLDVGSHVPYRGPGLEVEGDYYLALWAGQELHRAVADAAQNYKWATDGDDAITNA